MATWISNPRFTASWIFILKTTKIAGNHAETQLPAIMQSTFIYFFTLSMTSTLISSLISSILRKISATVSVSSSGRGFLPFCAILSSDSLARSSISFLNTVLNITLTAGCIKNSCVKYANGKLNRALAEDISKVSSGASPALLNKTLDAATRHAADDRRIAHMTLVSYMNRLIDTMESVKGLSYTVIFSGNGYVPTKSLRKSSILFHRTADEEEWLVTANFIMGRFCMPSEYLPLSESLRRYVGSISETTEDFIWMNHISLAYNESGRGQGVDSDHVTSETAQAERDTQSIEDNGTQSGAGLVLTAPYITESGENKFTSVKIDGDDLPTHSGESMEKEELLRYVSDLTACVRPAIDRLGENTCNMIANDIKKNG